MVQERRSAPGGSHTKPDFKIQNVQVLASQVSWIWRAPSRTHGRVCDFLEQRRGLQDPLAGQPGAGPLIGAARQEDSLLESQMQLGSLQHPHNPIKGASEHFHFLSVLAGTYDDTVRNTTSAAWATCATASLPAFPLRVPKC